MLTLFMISFWVGLSLTLITTLFGGHGSHHLHIHLGSHQAEFKGGHSPFNLSTILAFLTVFGGTGYILLNSSLISGVWIILIAAVIGFLIAAMLFIFLSKVLLRNDSVMSEVDYQLAGTLGTISIPVQTEGIGEMKYVLNGTTRSIGVKEQDGLMIPQGAKVVILSVEKGIAVVSMFDEPVNLI
jgi:membrane protein implicated in regulation of membrane protease activity